MPKCERVGTCAFFNNRMQSMPAVAKLVKQQLCEDDCSRCARYAVFKAGYPTPDNLYPDDLERAREIIATARARQDPG